MRQKLAMAGTSYIQGHDAATLQSHQSRSAKKQADYLLPHIRSDSHILDVGCGPGTITIDFATYAVQGKVIGVDSSSEVIEQAKEEAIKRKMSKEVTFEVAGAHDLPYPDNGFDIVHCHAVLVHLPDPVAAMKEMRRVCKKGGLIAAREPDWSTCVIHPYYAKLERWKEVFGQLKRNEGAEPNAGRHLSEWAVNAGFSSDDVTLAANVLSYSGREQVKWWGELYSSRVKTEMGKRAVSSGLATKQEVEQFSKAYLDWSKEQSAIWAMMHMRLLCRK
ncbi:Hypothetical predicted protein [Lecanosticta acicola]|uniref:Methyltransferase domain-containing protein n=1 Tax=Lecanosticta acicola TaxID=111012 RepID=A0AAI8Z0R4_9PEZI|nr:Hypothetical predicted protein [Lecanosticta acicola]